MNNSDDKMTVDDVSKTLQVLQKEGVTVETENSRQMNLFEFLAENYKNMPNDKVKLTVRGLWREIWRD